MTYKFVTREYINDIVVADEGGVELRSLCLRLLAERGAYREVAIKIDMGWTESAGIGGPPNKMESTKYVDAEAARVLEK